MGRNPRLEKLGQINELALHSMYAIGAIHELLQDFDRAGYVLPAMLDTMNVTLIVFFLDSDCAEPLDIDAALPPGLTKHSQEHIFTFRRCLLHAAK